MSDDITDNTDNSDISGILHHRCDVTPYTAAMRLDKFLASALPQLSRSRLQALITAGNVTLASGASLCDPARKVKSGEEIIVNIPPPEPAIPQAQPIALNVVYEDKYLIVINKPAGLTVHPAAGHADGTLVNALLAHCGDSLSGIGGVMRPGIVHRLDKDTSGLLVAAKNDAAHQALAQQLAQRSMKRRYRAIIWGTPVPACGMVAGNIGRSPKNRKKMAVVEKGGKEAVTHYKLMENYGIASMVECELASGRTHQIRVHMRHIGHPLLGDALYGRRPPAGSPVDLLDFLQEFNRQALHACDLCFTHPQSGEKQSFTCPLPPDMQQLLNLLRGLK